MENNQKYGILLDDSITLHRVWFKEMCQLIGIKVLYRAPLPGKHYTTYAELESNFAPPIVTGCIFEDHPTQQSLKKMGWMAELSDNASIIHVNYDLPNLQYGSLFIVPSGIDNASGRLFRVSKMLNGIVYPATITCEIVPEYQDTIDKDELYDYSQSSFNALNQEEDPMY